MKMNLPGYEEGTVMCPYDKSHIILRSRIQNHLIRCARNHPDIILERCPFDSTHHLRPEEKEAHILSCTSRATFDEYRYTMLEKKKVESPESAAAVQLPHAAISEESWDDINVPTYDPQLYVQQAPVLRNLYGHTKSERRAFREEERQRLGGMKKE